MTTFAQFQSYYLRKIWRTGDVELTQDLPSLIKEAEARINRDLREQSLANTSLITITEGATFQLPGDFRELISGSVNGWPLNKAVPVEQTSNTKAHSEGPLRGPFYTIIGNRLIARGAATAIVPGILDITYFMGITPYESDPTRPFYDDNPDFFVSALNIYTYDYLREFDMKSQNEAAYDKLLDSMVRNSNYARFPSGQLSMPMPR